MGIARAGPLLNANNYIIYKRIYVKLCSLYTHAHHINCIT